MIEAEYRLCPGRDLAGINLFLSSSGGGSSSQVGDREIVVDSAAQQICEIRNVLAWVERFAEVSDEHAATEGEG